MKKKPKILNEISVMNITTTIHINQKAKKYIITRFKPLDFETMTSNLITHWTWLVTLEL